MNDPRKPDEPRPARAKEENGSSLAKFFREIERKPDDHEKNDPPESS